MSDYSQNDDCCPVIRDTPLVQTSCQQTFGGFTTVQRPNDQEYPDRDADRIKYLMAMPGPLSETELLASIAQKLALAASPSDPTYIQVPYYQGNQMQPGVIFIRQPHPSVPSSQN
jgi:hypothetical protein